MYNFKLDYSEQIKQWVIGGDSLDRDALAIGGTLAGMLNEAAKSVGLAEGFDVKIKLKEKTHG